MRAVLRGYGVALALVLVITLVMGAVGSSYGRIVAAAVWSFPACIALSVILMWRSK